MAHLSFDVRLNACELLVPVRLDLIEPRLQGDERLGPQPEHPHPGVGRDPFVDHDPASSSTRRCRLIAGAEVPDCGCELTGAVRPLAEQLHDLPAGRVGERFHTGSSTVRLRSARSLR